MPRRLHIVVVAALAAALLVLVITTARKECFSKDDRAVAKKTELYALCLARGRTGGMSKWRDERKDLYVKRIDDKIAETASESKKQALQAGKAWVLSNEDPICASGAVQKRRLKDVDKQDARLFSGEPGGKKAVEFVCYDPGQATEARAIGKWPSFENVSVDYGTKKDEKGHAVYWCNQKNPGLCSYEDGKNRCKVRRGYCTYKRCYKNSIEMIRDNNWRDGDKNDGVPIAEFLL